METLLSDGLSQLCRDPEVESLIAPRREDVIFLLTQYISEIESHNPALGLVGTNDHTELIVRHILDSLSPLAIFLKLLPEGNLDPDGSRRQVPDTAVHIADVGSGAGLPGIPLAIAMPDASFTLIERMGRRAGFLRNVLASLGLSNIVVEEAEMEKAKTGRFNMVTFRALKPLEPKMYKKLARLCIDGGCLAAYKGRREKIETEMAALEKFRPDIAGKWNVTPCPVPFLDEERHLVVIR